MRSDLEDDPADEARVDGARRLDRAAGGLLDRRDDRARLARRRARRTVVSSTARRFCAWATSASSSALISGISPARPFSATRRTKLRTSSSASAASCSSTAALPVRLDLRVAQERAQLGHLVHRARERARGRRRPRRRGPPPARPRRARGRTCAARRPLGVALLQRGEVELGDRLVDEPALILGVEDLARHAGRRLEREVGDLGADQVERALRLGVDLALRLLEPARALDSRLPPSRARSARPRPCARRRGSPPPRPSRRR